MLSKSIIGKILQQPRPDGANVDIDGTSPSGFNHVESPELSNASATGSLVIPLAAHGVIFSLLGSGTSAISVDCSSPVKGSINAISHITNKPFGAMSIFSLQSSPDLRTIARQGFEMSPHHGTRPAEWIEHSGHFFALHSSTAG